MAYIAVPHLVFIYSFNSYSGRKSAYFVPQLLAVLLLPSKLGYLKAIRDIQDCFRRNKDCHVGIGKTAKYGRCTGRWKTVFFARARGRCGGTRTSISRWGSDLRASLGHQGS